jgi:hypothetical protein
MINQQKKSEKIFQEILMDLLASTNKDLKELIQEIQAENKKEKDN